MRVPPHRIRRQRWLVKARSQEQAFALDRRLRHDLEDVLLPALATGFDEVASGDDIVRLPKLELRVRIAGVDDVTAKLPGLLLREAAAQLRAIAGRTASPAESALSCRRLSAREDRVELLTRYLETGSLPWQLTGGGETDIIADLQEAVPPWLEGAPARWPRRDWSGHELTAFALRLLQLVPESEWVTVARAVTADLPVESRAQLTDAVAALASTEVTGGRSDRLQLAAAAIAASRLDRSGKGTRQVAAAVASVMGKVRDKTGRRAAARFLRRWLPTAEGPGEPSRPSVAAARAAASRRGAPSPPPNVAGPGHAPSKEMLVEARVSRQAAGATQADAPSEEFALAVPHAGLILLHPFLPKFFASTGITSAGVPHLDASVLARAAALLYLLATGREEAYEFELGFIKVLIGIGPEAPLFVGGGLVGGSDKDEADALLRAVIGHWAALKSTSVEGLRTSFLQRAALLREESEGWRLRVPSEPFDVLLEHLPWGVGVATLPWISKPIFTQWRTP